MHRNPKNLFSFFGFLWFNLHEVVLLLDRGAHTMAFDFGSWSGQ